MVCTTVLIRKIWTFAKRTLAEGPLVIEAHWKQFLWHFAGLFPSLLTP